MSRWIELGREQNPTVLDEPLVRAAMAANARYACDDRRGRAQGDPVFEEVVEARQRWVDYDAHADLPHWCLRRLGLRDETVLNRDDGGTTGWKAGASVVRLLQSTGAAFRRWRPGQAFEPVVGTIGFVGESGAERTFVVAGWDGARLRSYDYGLLVDGRHAARAVERHVETRAGRICLYDSARGWRPWVGALDPAELLRRPFDRGALLPAEVPDYFEGGRAVSPPSEPPSSLSTERALQLALKRLGFDPGPVTGVMTLTTRDAVRAFQASCGLPTDGIAGPVTRARLREQLAALGHPES